MTTDLPEQLKDPNAVLDWKFDWSKWLQVGEQLSSATITVSPGLTLNSSSYATVSATAWLSGGVDGQVYQVTCEIVTNQSRTDDRSISVRCKKRVL